MGRLTRGYHTTCWLPIGTASGKGDVFFKWPRATNTRATTLAPPLLPNPSTNVHVEGGGGEGETPPVEKRATLSKVMSVSQLWDPRTHVEMTAAPLDLQKVGELLEVEKIRSKVRHVDCVC